jgi:hypothetical protein
VWALLAHLAGRDLHADVLRLNRAAVWVPVAALLVAAWVYKLADSL